MAQASAGSLKVLQVCTSAAWGGMEMHVAALAQQLAEAGHRLLVLCARDSGLEHELQSKDFPHAAVKAGGYVRPGAARQAAKLLRTFRPDVVHVHYSKDLWWLVPAMRRFPEIGLVLSKHIGTQRPKRDLLHRYLYARVNFVIAISEVIRQNILDTHPVAAGKVMLVHSGVDLQRFNPGAIDREKIRRELGLAKKSIAIGIVGRLQKSKGYVEFLQMAARLQAECPECVFWMVGEATRGEAYEADQILQLRKQLGLERRVHHLGFRKDIPQLLSAMDIFVFPTHAEAFGLVLIEAMAMQTPVVSSNCDGVLDIVEPDRTGFLVPPRNVDALVNTVRQLIENEERRLEMGRLGRRRVEQFFSKTKMVQEICKIYHQCKIEI